MIHEALICQDTDGLPEIRIDADHDGTYEKPVTAGYRQKTINEIINRNHQRNHQQKPSTGQSQVLPRLSVVFS